MQVVVTEFMDPAALEAFGSEIDVTYDPALVDDRDALLAAVAEAEAVIVRNRTRVDAAFLAAAPRLRVVGRLGVGLDNIDIAACDSRGVTVHPATGANALSVVEYVLTATLSLLRGAYGANAAMLSGAWPRNALVGREAAGRVLGLVGFGGIARAVASKAQGLGMDIIAHDPFLAEDDPAWQGVRRASLAELLGLSDVVSLHVPLTEATRGLIDADAIAAMRDGAIVINTARGGVVDEPALAEALRDGKLGGAALDVFATEPLTREAAQVFQGLSNIILTPHIAGVTQEGNVRVSDVTVQNVIAGLGHGGA